MRVFNMEKDILEDAFSYNLGEKDKICEHLKNKSNIQMDDIRRIALWKYNRIIEMDDMFCTQLYSTVSKNKVSIEDKEVHEMIERLVSFEGVGFPLASTILKFINPDVFPIIDVRAYRAIYGKKIYYNQYNFKIYIDYTKRIYDMRDKFNISLSEVDERLYEFDKKYNGKI